MKKTLLIIAAASVTLLNHSTKAQSMDYGMVAAFVQSPAGSNLVGGGFNLLGVTPSSGFNPTNASLASLLNTANMLSVSNAFTTIDAANPGQFAVGGLLTTWSTGATIANGTKLYLLASLSPTFDAASPWALVTGADWNSPNPTDPFGFVNMELSTAGNTIIASSGAAQVFFAEPVSQTAADNNLILVPEPSTYALLSLAGLAFGGYAARRRRRA
jgi:hypothetical protein